MHGTKINNLARFVFTGDDSWNIGGFLARIQRLISIRPETPMRTISSIA
jgi:hypothetical protein